MGEISPDEIRHILREYLTVFYVKISKEEDQKVRDVIGRIRTFYLQGSNLALKKVVACLLLSKGRKLEYRYGTTAQLLSDWLGKSPFTSSSDSFENNKMHIDYRTKILILHNIKYQPTNKALEMLVAQQVVERENLGLVTMVLDEENLQTVKFSMKDYGLEVFDKSADSILGMKKIFNKYSVQENDPIL